MKTKMTDDWLEVVIYIAFIIVATLAAATLIILQCMTGRDIYLT